MSEIIGKLISIMKRASNSLEVFTFHKSGCMVYLLILEEIKQIIAVKIPSRKHYISKALASKYLQATRKLIDETLTHRIKEDSYILNILVGDQLSTSCYDLKSVSLHNMDMVFNLKRINDDKIISSVCNALYTKTDAWSKKIKDKCKSKGVKPYGPQKTTLRRLENAKGVLWRYGKRK